MSNLPFKTHTVLTNKFVLVIITKNSSADEIPERDVTYIILSVYLLTTEL